MYIRFAHLSVIPPCITPKNVNLGVRWARKEKKVKLCGLDDSPSLPTLVNPRSWRGHYFLAVFFDVTHDRLSERALTSLITISKFVSCLYVQLQFILEIHSVQSDLFFCPYLSDQDCDRCFKCFPQAGTQRRCFLLAAKDVSFFPRKCISYDVEGTQV